MAPTKRPQCNTPSKHKQPRSSLNPNIRHQTGSGTPQIFIPHNTQHHSHSNSKHALPSSSSSPSSPVVPSPTDGSQYPIRINFEHAVLPNASNPAVLTPGIGHQRLLHNHGCHPPANMRVPQVQAGSVLAMVAILTLLIFVVGAGYLLFRRRSGSSSASKSPLGEETGGKEGAWIELQKI